MRTQTIPPGAARAGPRAWAAVAAVLLSLSGAACRAGDAPGRAPRSPDPEKPKAMRIYVGTYTGPKSKGIYQLRLDLETGRLGEPELAGETASPSFLAIHPNRRFLYAVNEVWGPPGAGGGSVSAFAIAPETGLLTPLGKQPSGGVGPCYVAVEAGGRCALAANYGSGSICALPIGDDGRLAPATAVVQHTGSGPDSKRQEGPHAHSIRPDPSGRFAMAADLGLDKILVYRLDPARGTLVPHDPPSASVAPGAGPRHTAFSPDGRFMYVINEMA
ncbi:MAG: lactonase family protein, partial [Planctomycetes bacterium]|nr:lactonase family protein [Planctomycetota bacterium]